MIGTFEAAAAMRRALIGAVLFAAGCIEPYEQPHDSSAHSSTDTKVFQGAYPIRTTATVGMVADLVHNIGGEWVKVDCLMGPGVDPHRYKTTPGDVRRLRS